MTAICQAGSRNKGKTKTDDDSANRGTQRKMDEKDQQMDDDNVYVDA